MATKTCTSCGGSGYNAMSGVIPGSQPNAPLCGTCGGSGYVNDDSGNGSSSCFTLRTPVLTSAGWTSLGSLTIGDYIETYNSSSQCIETKPITAIRKHPECQIWNIHTSGTDHPIETTWAHPFLTQRGWVWTKFLKPDDILVSADGRGNIFENRIEMVRRSETTMPVSNLITYEHHTYIVKGAIAHNYSCFRKIRSFLSDLSTTSYASPTQLRPRINSLAVWF